MANSVSSDLTAQLQEHSGPSVFLTKWTEGRNAEYYVPSIFFEKARDKKVQSSVKILQMISKCELVLYFTILFPSVNFE